MPHLSLLLRKCSPARMSRTVRIERWAERLAATRGGGDHAVPSATIPAAATPNGLNPAPAAEPFPCTERESRILTQRRFRQFPDIRVCPSGHVEVNGFFKMTDKKGLKSQSLKTAIRGRKRLRSPAASSAAALFAAELVQGGLQQGHVAGPRRHDEPSGCRF